MTLFVYHGSFLHDQAVPAEARMFNLLNYLLDRCGLVLSIAILTLAIVLLSEVVTIVYSVIAGSDISETALILGTLVPAVLCPPAYFVILKTLMRLRQSEYERTLVIKDLEEALAGVRQLSGMLPICSHCKKIRDDKGYWEQVESYISSHSEAQFSHGICPSCAEALYPDLVD